MAILIMVLVTGVVFVVFGVVFADTAQVTTRVPDVAWGSTLARALAPVLVDHGRAGPTAAPWVPAPPRR